MKKTIWIGGAALIALAIPAIAAQHAGARAPGAGGMHEMMTKDMPRTEVEGMVKEHFAMVDANGDGAITMDEVQARHQAMHNSRMSQHFEEMDTNSDGSISRDEFDAAHVREGKPGGPGRPGPMAGGPEGGMRRGPMGMDGGPKMFEKADANQDGKVTLTEATSAALAHFDEVDADKNGIVTPAERMEYWKTKKGAWMAGDEPQN